MAATTGGVDDVYLYHRFAEGVHQYGPVMMYGHRLPGVNFPYNHPPLTGLMLEVIYHLHGHSWMSFPFLIRVPSTCADLVTVWLVFEIVRRYRPLSDATIAAVLAAFSPVTFIISGYHGNTDSVFIMLTLLSLYLLGVRSLPVTSAACAGASFALGLNFKIVPIIVLPLLLLIAKRTGNRHLLAYLAGSGLVMAVLWTPVVLRNWGPFKTNVLLYPGVAQRQWGLMQFGRTLGLPTNLLAFLQGPGRFVVVLAATTIPLAIAWKWPQRSVPAIGLSFMLFLLLLPATGTQYLVWAAIPAFLIRTWPAAAYNVVAGSFLIMVYNRWNHADAPWHWRAQVSGGSLWTRSEVLMAGIVWATLLTVTVIGFLPRKKHEEHDRPETVSEASTAADFNDETSNQPVPVGVENG